MSERDEYLFRINTEKRRALQRLRHGKATVIDLVWQLIAQQRNYEELDVKRLGLATYVTSDLELALLNYGDNDLLSRVRMVRAEDKEELLFKIHELLDFVEDGQIWSCLYALVSYAGQKPLHRELRQALKTGLRRADIGNIIQYTNTLHRNGIDQTVVAYVAYQGSKIYVSRLIDKGRANMSDLTEQHKIDDVYIHLMSKAVSDDTGARMEEDFKQGNPLKENEVINNSECMPELSRGLKPRYHNTIQTHIEWNAYNKAHYTKDDPPPKLIKGYTFVIFYPLLANTDLLPHYSLLDGANPQNEIIQFAAVGPYRSISFEIVRKPWKLKHTQFYFERQVLFLKFKFNKTGYKL